MSTNPVLIDIPVPIETPRLILRNVLPGDGKILFEAKRESIDELKKWMPWAKELGTEDDSEVVARENHAQFILRKDMMMVGFEKATGKFVIGTGLHRFDWERGQFEIGYWVRTTEAGKGFATESTNALIRFAFNALSARKVTITHADGNEGSRKVIEKLGFQREGIMRDESFLPDGRIVDQHVYGRFDTQGLPDLNVTWGEPRYAP